MVAGSGFPVGVPKLGRWAPTPDAATFHNFFLCVRIKTLWAEALSGAPDPPMMTTFSADQSISITCNDIILKEWQIRQIRRRAVSLVSKKHLLGF